MKICIDPGHGGKSPGASGRYSLEKDINLIISLLLKDYLVKGGIEVVMTRNDDSYVDLKTRCNLANTAQCGLFISIHCNSFNDTRAAGIETYYYPGSAEGMKLASSIQKAAVSYSGIKDRGIKESDFFVLRYTVMPAILLECAFISNISEEKMLNSRSWQIGFAETLSSAAFEYCEIKKRDA